MPELPDITVYVEHLVAKTKGKVLEKVRLASPFVLRTAVPPISAVQGKPVKTIERLGKRIVFGFPDKLFVVVHLMIAGRFKWKPFGTGIPGRIGLAAFDFMDAGTLILTEASSKKRASIHVVQGKEELLATHGRGGLEPIGATFPAFAERLRVENHTLKRSLTDPRLFSGIGNAYSDEILHHAQMSPVKLTNKLTDTEIETLLASTQTVLEEWTVRLRKKAGDFPENVTAFQPEMAVHGKFGKPCPRCGKPVQRIRYAANEMNYCPSCQTDGKLLADRSLSRLMKGDWPKSLEELEAKKEAARTGLPVPAPLPKKKSRA